MSLGIHLVLQDLGLHFQGFQILIDLRVSPSHSENPGSWSFVMDMLQALLFILACWVVSWCYCFVEFQCFRAVG